MLTRRYQRLIGFAFVAAFCGATWAQEPVPVKPLPAPPPTTQPASQPASLPTTGPVPKIEVQPTAMDIGDVWQGMPAKREFTIKNTGGAPLTLEVKSSCGCTVPSNPKTPLAPGETTTFNVTYDAKTVGKVEKNVRILTNAADQQNVVILVTGNVKPIYSVSPGEKIWFNSLEMNDSAEQTVTLENRYGQPLELKLKDGQNFGKFDVALKAVEDKQKYELRIATKPPLTVGQNRTAIVVEIGDKLPPLTLHVLANAQPRVFAMPMKLLAIPGQATTVETVRVQYRLDHPVKITDVKCNLVGVKWEPLPDPVPAAGAEVGHHELKVTLPAFDDVPEQGAKLEVYTDDPLPEYHKLEIDIGRRAGKPVTTAPVPIDRIPPGVPLPPPPPGEKKP